MFLSSTAWLWGGAAFPGHRVMIYPHNANLVLLFMCHIVNRSVCLDIVVDLGSSQPAVVCFGADKKCVWGRAESQKEQPCLQFMHSSPTVFTPQHAQPHTHTVTHTPRVEIYEGCRGEVVQTKSNEWRNLVWQDVRLCLRASLSGTFVFRTLWPLMSPV